MKKPILALATALLSAASIQTLAAEEIESTIDAVTVYARGAEVTRVAQVGLMEGANVLTLGGFPGNIDLGRIQARTGHAGVKIGSIQFDVLQQREVVDAEVQRLQDAITETEDTIAAIDDEIAAAELQLQFLQELAEDRAGNERNMAATGQADIGSWQQALDSIGKGALEARAQIRKQGRLRREAEKDLSVLERELEDKKGARADSARLMVSLNSAAALETELRITYFQRQARWRSTYSAHLDTTRSQLRLSHEAEVSQATSEDWPNVLLALSTGDPGGRMEAPEQNSRFLDLWDPQAERLRALEARQELFAADAQMAQASILETKVSRFSVNYQAQDRTDISNNSDQAQLVPLAEYHSEVSLVTRTTPRQNMAAYLTARFVHTNDAPLLAGRMRVFLDNAYAGVTRLAELLPGAEAVLPLGPDRQVDINVIDQGGEKGREGLLSTRNSELTDFLFEIINRHSQPTQVEIIDYYPVARDERIEVTVPRGATEPHEKDFEDRPGVIVWRKELEPGERWRISHQYEVSYPRNAMLNPRL